LAGKLRITWKKSAIGYREDQKRTIRALGLKRLGQTVEHEDTRPLRGMITKVRHLVEVADNSSGDAEAAAPAKGAKNDAAPANDDKTEDNDAGEPA
jgi:large subunit ribosomal protein L30